jgi:hypothetical protein
MTISSYRITRYAFPRSRPIGDSQIRVDMHYLGTLELFSDTGVSGLGFFGSLLSPLPPLAKDVAANIAATGAAQAVEQYLWLLTK